MMKNSATSYLESFSSEDLLGFLCTGTMGNRWRQYALAVPQMFRILEDRGVEIPEEIKRSWEAFGNADKEQIPPTDFLLFF